MTGFQINDFDAAYTNGAYIPDGHLWPEAWVAPAAKYRENSKNELDISYGAHERQRYDLFLPKDDEPKGLFVFIHGGYWRALDKSYWSHLAQGMNDNGWAVAMPSYVLCPEVNIADITAMIATCIEHIASRIDGPIILSGHSAGGHLASSMVCEDTVLSQTIIKRVVHVISISGVHDLRPLLRTEMNKDFRLDSASARAQSPALKIPIDGVRLTTWVGGAERDEFRRQSELLASMWRGMGAWTQYVEVPGRHHFDVIDDLTNANSALISCALSSA